MSRNNELRQISPEQLAQLGAPHTVYIRPFEDRPGSTRFVIRAADGAPLGIIGSHAEALEAAEQGNFLPVTVH